MCPNDAAAENTMHRRFRLACRLFRIVRSRSGKIEADRLVSRPIWNVLRESRLNVILMITNVCRPTCGTDRFRLVKTQL